MEPQIISKPAFDLLGVSERIDPAHADYTAIWGRFEAHHAAVAAASVDPGYYGVCLACAEPGKIEYLAGMAVQGVAQAPEGLALRHIPAQQYAVFACTMGTISATYAAIYGQWLPASGYECDEPGADFEYYPPDMSGSPDEPVYIYKAIRPAAAAADLAEPRFVERRAFRVAGLAYLGKNQQGEIAALWEHGVMPRIGELAAIQVGVDTYGVGRMSPGIAPDEFEYLAGVEVSSFERLPEGMVGWEIPANRYAVLPAHGIPELAPVADRFYGQWLPRSAYRAAGDYNFECYPPTFEQDQIIYWHFPIAPKEGAAH